MTTMIWGFHSPVLLFALLAILVPIVIHIFSQSKGVRVAFGSLIFIKQSKPTRLTQLRLVDLFLLLLRIVLLIISVLFLAKFYLSPTESTQEIIVLITEDWLTTANEGEKTQLVTNQYNSQYLLNGSQIKLSRDDIINWQLSKDSAVNSINTWALVEQAINYFPATKNFVVYTTNRLNQFYGNKLLLPANIQWQILSVDKKEQNSSIAPDLKLLSIVVVNQEQLVIDSSKEKQREQLRLKKALDIITQQFPQITVKYISYEEAKLSRDVSNKGAVSTDWIIYLANRKLPENIAKTVANGGRLLVPDSRVLFLGNKMLVESLVTFDDLSLLSQYFKEFEVAGLSNIALNKAQSGAVYSFNKKLTALGSWHAALEQNYFPQVLLNLLLTQQNVAYFLTHNYLTAKQITSDNKREYFNEHIGELAESIVTTHATKANAINNTPETHLALFLLLLLVWACERLLSEFAQTKSRVLNKVTIQRNESTNE